MTTPRTFTDKVSKALYKKLCKIVKKSPEIATEFWLAIHLGHPSGVSSEGKKFIGKFFSIKQDSSSRQLDFRTYKPGAQKAIKLYIDEGRAPTLADLDEQKYEPPEGID